MKFDKGLTRFYADIGKAIALRIKPSAKLDELIKDGNPKPLRDWLKNRFGESGFHDSDISSLTVPNKGLELEYNKGLELEYNYELNNLGERKLTLTWSQLATLLRDDDFRKKYVFPNEQPEHFDDYLSQWEIDNNHLCGNYTDDAHCEFLLTSETDTVVNGKKLGVYCVYCTAENKIRKINDLSFWTGLSPKFCPKRKALEQNNGEPTEADITLFKQYKEEFDISCNFEKVFGFEHKYAKQHRDRASELYNEIVNKGLEQAYKKWREMNREKTEQKSMCDGCANNDGSCRKPKDSECERYVSTVHLNNLLFLAKAKSAGKDSVTDFLDKFLEKYPNFDATRFEELKPFLKTGGKTYLDVFVQHYPSFELSKVDEFADDVCVAECFDDVSGCLGNTEGTHDTACKISCTECWRSECALQWKLSNGTEKYIEPYLTAEKEEDKMTPNFNFKGFISEGNQLKQVPLDMLVPYHNHKFKLYEGERLSDMVNSIKENGVLTPIIVRNMGGEHYEILAGHNRTNAARLAGLTVIPAIVKENLSDDEAEMYVIETNVMQRGFDDLSISERAAVIAARHSAMFDENKRRAIERELAALSGNTPADEDEEQENGEKKSKLAAVGESYGLSKDSVARLIRIDKLSDELKSYVDSGDIPLRAGVNLSYLLPNEQKMLVRVMIDCVNTKISMKQSELLRELSREKNLTENNVREIVLTGKLTDHSAPTPRKPIKVKISADIGAKYFAPNWDEDKVRQIVELALEQYFTSTDRLIMDEKDEYQI